MTIRKNTYRHDCVSGGCITSGAQHFPQILAHGISKSLHAIHRDVPLTPFDLTNVGSVKPSPFRQNLLRQLQFFSGVPKPNAKTNFGGLSVGWDDVFGLHRPKIAFVMTLGLQSLSSMC
jgi:hypothetical protein